MSRPNITLSLLALALAATTVSCSQKQTGSDLVDMGVSSGGLILQTTEQSCVDVSTPTSPPTRSISAPALHFGGFSVTWKSGDSKLFVGEIKITAKSPKFSGGKFEATLDSTEIEALLGATNATLSAASSTELASSAGGKVYASNSTSKEKSGAGGSLAACSLNVGGITLADTTTTPPTFTATVQIELIGTAQKVSDSSDESVVLKTISTSATFYD